MLNLKHVMPPFLSSRLTRWRVAPLRLSNSLSANEKAVQLEGEQWRPIPLSQGWRELWLKFRSLIVGSRGTAAGLGRHVCRESWVWPQLSFHPHQKPCGEITSLPGVSRHALCLQKGKSVLADKPGKPLTAPRTDVQPRWELTYWEERSMHKTGYRTVSKDEQNYRKGSAPKHGLCPHPTPVLPPFCEEAWRSVMFSINHKQPSRKHKHHVPWNCTEILQLQAASGMNSWKP